MHRSKQTEANADVMRKGHTHTSTLTRSGDPEHTRPRDSGDGLWAPECVSRGRFTPSSAEDRGRSSHAAASQHGSSGSRCS